MHSAFLLVRASRPDKTPRQEEEKSGLDDHSGAMGTLRRAARQLNEMGEMTRKAKAGGIRPGVSARPRGGVQGKARVKPRCEN